MSKVTIHERKKKEQNGKEWRLMNRCGVSGLQGCWLGWPLKLLGLFANFQLCESALNYRTSLTEYAAEDSSQCIWDYWSYSTGMKITYILF
jgi:hypothetical protein